MTHQQARKFVRDVMEYFQTMERAAELRNKRIIVQHFQECWLVVCEAYYGDAVYPPTLSLRAPTAAGDSRPPMRPRWFVEKYSRPMRKVVARTSKTVAGRRRGESFTEHFDVLSCGHLVADRAAECGTAPAKHRRCDQCQTTIVSEPSETLTTSSLLAG